MEIDFIDNTEIIVLKNNSIRTLISYFVVISIFIFIILALLNALTKVIMETHFFGFVYCIIGIITMIYFIMFFMFEIFRTITLRKDGYEVKFFFYKKFYFWKDIKTKISEDFKYIGRRGDIQTRVKRNVYFCNEKINKPKKQEPRHFLMYHACHFSFFSILLTDEETANEKNKQLNYFRLDERLFKKKMREWGIEVEEL